MIPKPGGPRFFVLSGSGVDWQEAKTGRLIEAAVTATR